MRKIIIIHAGGMKESWFKEAALEYIKRLSADFRVDHIEIKEGPTLEKEADRILEKLDRLGKSAYKIALDREGARLSSEKFAELICDKQCIAFIIGSSHGLADRVKQAADFRLSFSDMTFPHSLFRVMLMEQIYRAYMIERGGAYHK